MKKITTILSMSAIVLFCAFMFAACSSMRLSEEEVKKVYTDAGFTITNTSTLLELEGLEKVFVVSKGNDSATIYIFADADAESEAGLVIKGDGLSFACQNVSMGQFVIDEIPVVVDVFDPNGYSLTSPKIIALTQPLYDLWASKN